MKLTVIVIATFVTAFVIGMGSMHLYQRRTSTDQGQPQVPQQPKGHSALVDRPAPMKSIASNHTGTEPVQNNSRPIPPTNVNGVDTNRLQAVSIKQKLMKRQGNYEYWAWRVNVENNTDEILTVYAQNRMAG